MLDVTIDAHRIRIGDRLAVSFQRTLRLPDDGRIYPLPPGLGAFPLYRVADYVDRLPSAWRERGGVFIPLYQREALWIGFSAAAWKPNAVQVAAGGVNAVSGGLDDGKLSDTPQNYLVCPPQAWLDGINSGDGSIRQFVAMPLGLGYSVEAAVTGEERIGGIQITVFDPRSGIFPDQPPPDPETGPRPLGGFHSGPPTTTEMGLGAGGQMRQKIYTDPHGFGVWNTRQLGRVEVHLLNNAQFRAVTGAEPPPTPIDAAVYTAHGLPWFDLYDDDLGDVSPPPILVDADTIAERDTELGERLPNDEPFDVPESQVVRRRPEDANRPRPPVRRPDAP